MVGCAPAADTARVSIQTANLLAPSLYPSETGLRWSYLPEGARVDDIRFTETVVGPAVINDQVWVQYRLTGGGQDVSHYRQVRDDGVFLKRQTRPGGSFTFDPPIRELPALPLLRVGETWSGSTRATGVFPNAPANQRTFELTVDYSYRVIDERTVRLAGTNTREYRVFIIDRTTRSLDASGNVVEELSQQIWFAPYVGRVKHENGWVLVDTNFTSTQRGR